jgi:hypothetical protein
MNKTLTKVALAASLLAPFTVAMPAVAATPNWDISGTWTFNDIWMGTPYVHTMVINAFNTTTGAFSGTGSYDADPALTWTIAGTVDGDNIDYLLTVQTVAPGVTLDGSGTITSSTAMSGTGYQSNLPGDPSSTNVTWTATGVATPVCNGSGFDNFALGSVNGQNGWSSTGSFDQAIVNNTYGYASFGCKSLRISDAVTSGSFGDQTFSASLTNEAGETDALNGGMSGGTRQNHFEAQFDLASTMSTEQTGMHMSVSPDRGDGARMSYLRFDDSASGIEVYFDDVQGTVPNGTNGCNTTVCANFIEAKIATITRAPHTIKFVMDFVDGASNDVVKIYIDGVLVKTGTSWEDYYRFDPESNPTLVSNSRTVDSLLFRESGTAHSANAGKGFLIDNFSSASSINNLLCPAAPAIAAAYLKENSIKPSSTTFKNIISLVAAHMGPQTNFNGVAACDAGYAAAVQAFIGLP